MRRRAEGEGGEKIGGAEEFEGAVLGGAEAAFFLGMKVVVAGEVQPAVDDVAEDFLGEGDLVFFGVGEGGVHRDADVAGVAERFVALEGDDIRRGRIVEVVGVEFGESGVGQEGDGEFARGDGGRVWRGKAEGAGSAAAGWAQGWEVGGGNAEIGVEVGECFGEGAAVEAEARVAVGEGEFAHGGGVRKGNNRSQVWERGDFTQRERERI